jgi:dihydroneopterin aldolase
VDRILLSGLEFFGRHGCHNAERELGQRFLIDIEIECDLRAAGEADDIVESVDYVALYDKAKELVEGEPVSLLETLAHRIAMFALENERVQSAWVRVRKPHIALPGRLDYVGVEVTRERDGETSDA